MDTVARNGLQIAPNIPPARELKRIALALTDEASRRLRRHDPDDMYKGRKCLKEIRAILRLVESSFPRAGTLRLQLRDVGRQLAVVREPVALTEMLDRLQAMDRERFDGLDPLRLVIAGGGQESKVDLAALSQRVDAAREEIEAWPPADQFLGDLKCSLRRNYRAARRRMNRAMQIHSPAAFHAWRKRAKEHWYCVRLFECALPALMHSRQEPLHRLARILGDHHDLAALRELSIRHTEVLGPATALRFWSSVTSRIQELEQQAIHHGAALFTETSRQWIRHVSHDPFPNFHSPLQ